MKITLTLSILLILYSCNNHRNRSDEIMKEFDRVNKSLEKTNGSIGLSTQALYDSIEKIYPESHLQQLRYSVSDFKGYMDDLKHRFIIACGDSTGEMVPEKVEADLEKTNKFFFGNGPGKDFLVHFKSIQQLLSSYTSNLELKKKIDQLIEDPLNRTKDRFMKAYFYDAPPVAALTILSKFENDISNMENKILQEYLGK